MSILTLKGVYTKGIFICEGGNRIKCILCKNFKYDEGEVYAQFKVENNNYILMCTVPLS